MAYPRVLVAAASWVACRSLDQLPPLTSVRVVAYALAEVSLPYPGEAYQKGLVACFGVVHALF